MLGRMGLLYRMKVASLNGALASEWSSNRLKLIAGVITLAVLVPGIFLLFRFLFSYIYGLEETFAGFGVSLARRLMSMTFMTLGVFIGISSFISGVSVVFRSWETSYLLTMPVRDSFTAFYRGVESWFNAGWAIFLLGIPIVLAFCVSLKVSLAATVLALAAFPFLMLVWLSAGTILLGASIRLSRSSGRIWRTAALLGILVAAGLFLILQNSQPSGIIAQENTALDALSEFVADLPVAGGRFWPHSLFSSCIISIDSGNAGAGLGCFGLLLMEAVVASAAAFVMICPGFRNMYSAVGAASSRKRGSSLLLRSGGRMRTMLSKDLLLFFRDPVQWSQLLLLTGLFLVYAMNIERFPTNIGQQFWRSILIYLNFSFSCFVTATLLVRFTYPSISLEGPGMSFLLQLPSGRDLVMKSKWIGSIVFIAPFIVGLGIWSALKIGVGSTMLTVSTAALLLMCIALVSINVGLGAIFPRFDRGSAANIASSQGGIIASFASMGYVLLAVSLLGVTLRNSFAAGFPAAALARNMRFSLGSLTVLTLAVCAGFIKAGYRSLRRRDF
jgi:ABC-2 type transport system permease protein